MTCDLVARPPWTSLLLGAYAAHAPRERLWGRVADAGVRQLHHEGGLEGRGFLHAQAKGNEELRGVEAERRVTNPEDSAPRRSLRLLLALLRHLEAAQA